MKLFAFLSLILLAGGIAHAANITGVWYTDGNQKIARQDLYPLGVSSNTISRVWDGNAINQFSGRGMTVGGALYLLNNAAADAVNVMVTVSSMTCGGGTGIVSVAVSSGNVWDTTTRPMQLFLAKYTQIVMVSEIPWGNSEFNEFYYPTRFRSAAQTWATRPDHDKFYPRGLVPMEEFAISSFTVSKSSSQAIWIDTWVSTSIVAGTCRGLINVYEGATVSTSVPYNITVYNAVLPSTHTFKTTVFVDDFRTDTRMNAGSVDLPARNHINQLLHAHGFSSSIGDLPDVTTNNYPSAQYQAYLDGSAYTAANGYGNARGYAVGQDMYMIGTYGNWSGANYPNFSTTNAATFCTAISSWSLNLASYPNARSALYLADEASSTTLVTSNEKWATWLSTKCAMAGSYVNSWVTNPYPTIQTLAPHVTMAVSHNQYGHDPNHNNASFAYTASTWQVAANQFLTTGATQAWRYNGEGDNGALFADEEEAYVPRQTMWADWIKLCTNGVCKGGHFFWHSNYWFDENNYAAANPLGQNSHDQSRTFGFDSGASAQWGRAGGGSQGDGTLIWPGTDSIKTPSYGFQGAYATWTLKEVRAGIDDADLANMAYAVNPSSTTAIMTALNTTILWDVPCTDRGDCTYNNTDDRGWSYDANAYTVGREALLQTIAGSPNTALTTLQGNIRVSGNVKFKQP